MARKLMLATFALSAGLFAGCGAARPSKYFQLTVPSDVGATPHTDSATITLLLGSFSAPHLYRDDRIVYSNGAQEMGTYEYERWASPPAEMLEEVLLRELRATGHYRSVRSMRSNAHGDFALRGRLYDFKEISGGSISTRVTFELEMRDAKTGSPVWSHYYTHDEPASGKGVPAIAAAIDHNAQKGILEAVASLDQYFASHPIK
jgi:ABC-type uncharacterized transport system auxiliary subunit